MLRDSESELEAGRGTAVSMTRRRLVKIWREGGVVVQVAAVWPLLEVRGGML